MSSYSQSTQQAHDVENQVCVDTGLSADTGKGKGTGPSNSDLVQKKLGGGTTVPPSSLKQSDLSVKSGEDFASAASAALGAIVPGPGSFASLRIQGKVPIYSAGALNCSLQPELVLEAAHTDAGKYEVILKSKVGLLAEAGTGTGGGEWWPKLLAYFKGAIQGSLKIVGDSAAEIINEFMLTLRMVVEGACDTAGVLPKIKEAMSEAVMSSTRRQQTMQEMDKDDSSTASFGGGVEAGVDASVGSMKVGAEFMFSTTIENRDANSNEVEMTSATTLTIVGDLEHKELGMQIPANVTFVSRNGKLDEWFVGFSATKQMPLGEFSTLVMIGTSWGAGFISSVANLIRNAGAKNKLNGVGPIADLIGGLSMGGDAMKYGVLGHRLKEQMARPDFKGQGSAEIQVSFNGQAGWSKEKGANVKMSVSTADMWTLGAENETPLFLEAKVGDNIVSFEASKADGAKPGT